MADDATLLMVNQLKIQLAGLVREVIADFEDGTLKAHESVALAMKGMLFASSLVALIQAGDAGMRQNVLNILEHGQLVMPT